VERIEHLPPSEHAEFYNSQAWTLNVTRDDMVAAGHSPSVRLFEAACCATPIISDDWQGLSDILAVGSEIIVADSAEQVLDCLSWPDDKRRSLGDAARARVLTAHTAAHRAQTLERLIVEAAQPHRITA
jgi:spore maturation protein CgeB